jgi:hypothetical protein
MKKFKINAQLSNLAKVAYKMEKLIGDVVIYGDNYFYILDDEIGHNLEVLNK